MWKVGAGEQSFVYWKASEPISSLYEQIQFSEIDMICRLCDYYMFCSYDSILKD